MIAWIIGSTSIYSKEVAKQLKEKGYTVLLMGRANLDYGATPGAQLESRETPDLVFININAEDYTYQEGYGSHNSMPSNIDWNNYSSMLDFKHSLYEYLYEINREVHVCEVTSSITYWPYKHLDCLPYSILRATQQCVAHAHSNKLNCFMVCPNGITDEGVYDYARLTVNLLQRAPDFGVYDLCDGGIML